jgi:hypothetical protein
MHNFIFWIRLVLIKCNEWASAEGFYVVVLQHLLMQVAAPLWKMLFLKCLFFFPPVSQGLEDISESILVSLESIM